MKKNFPRRQPRTRKKIEKAGEETSEKILNARTESFAVSKKAALNEIHS